MPLTIIIDQALTRPEPAQPMAVPPGYGVTEQPLRTIAETEDRLRLTRIRLEEIEKSVRAVVEEGSKK